MAMRWYSVSVLSNFEEKVAEAIRESTAQHHLEDEIAEVIVPTEDVIEIRRGKKVQTKKRFMPGYVLVKMEMSDRTVTGFLGPQGKPTPMRDEEVARIQNQVVEGKERPRSIITFQTGEQVNVTDGPFEGFSGMVEEVDQSNSRLKVSVSIFGRATPVELEFTQVAKAS
jgi:transcriptional antiterminator NusG